MNEIIEKALDVLARSLFWALNYFWLIILLFVGFKFWRRSSGHRKMKDLSRLLGLEFQNSSSDELLRVKTTVQSQAVDIKTQKVGKFILTCLDFVISLFHHWKMAGKWNGVPVAVFSETKGGKNGTQYTVVRAETESTKPIGLQIAAESFMSTFGRNVFGNNDITSGNEQLDKKVLIKAKLPDQAKMVLSDVFLQEAILQAFEYNPSMTIDDQYVSLNFRGTLKNEETLRSALDHAVRTAQALRRANR